MFFGGVGMCADLRMLGRGGKALVIFLLVLFPYVLVQNALGVAVAKALDLHPIFGLVSGSITLVGGHGTGAAYAERFSEVNNLQHVMELSMTVATIGLILGGIIAGPGRAIRHLEVQPALGRDRRAARGGGGDGQGRSHHDDGRDRRARGYPRGGWRSGDTWAASSPAAASPCRASCGA
jgi:hypothetical protein